MQDVRNADGKASAAPRDSILTHTRSDKVPAPGCVLVAGASGGIGRALCEQLASSFSGVHVVRLARRPEDLPTVDAHCLDIACDIADESAIEQAVAGIPREQTLDWILIASGWLHGDGYRPEKTWRQLDAEHLLHAYRINAIGPALLLKHLLERLNPDYPCRIGVLSARVGSISDNRLGGWYAYRASKAALNQLVRTAAVELRRSRPQAICVALHPGTVDTGLSAPFAKSGLQVQAPAEAAARLLAVIGRLGLNDSGEFFDHRGEPVPW